MEKNHTEIGKQRGIYRFNFVLGRTAEKLSIFQKIFFNISQKKYGTWVLINHT